jgi:hypothetical protein
MKKWLKVTLWIVFVSAAIFGGLFWIGLSMHNKAEAFVHSRTNYTDVKAITTSDTILCGGSSAGIIVGQFDTKEPTYFPICAPIFGEASLGKWANEVK